MSGKWTGWKIGAAAAVGVIVLADIALCFVLWQMGREGSAQMIMQRNQLAYRAQQFEADVARGKRIRASLPQVGRDCDDFYKNSFLDSKTVYSTVDSDITALASKAGVKTTVLTFKPMPVPNRSVSQLDISMGVDGDYSALLKFINGLERSKNFYFLTQLQLGEGSAANAIRLQLNLHTYFRT